MYARDPTWEDPVGVQVVWFKKDLRVVDHRPLVQAAERGPVLPLFVVEPGYWSRPEHDPSQLVFATGCLRELDEALRSRGSRLVVRTGRIRDVLAALDRTVGLDGLWSHEETGCGWTYGRDRAVARWCAARSIPWTQIQPSGVVRRLPTRDGWGRRWKEAMARPVVPAPDRLPAPAWPEGFDAGTVPEPETLGIGPCTKPMSVWGGRSHALGLLDSFLTVRGVGYRADMASPVAGWTGCSRLAPYLTWGALSLREVFHATEARSREVQRRLRAGEPLDARWAKSLSSFRSRLSWRDHFIQKLEDEPALEFRNLHRGYDGLRLEDVSAWPDVLHERFEAWCAGRTGYPMVDAAMRCLHHTGWINFRMRAMLVSFASHHLWLHWRPTAVFLAQHFVDYEPGIHFSQFQMQSGTTGINSLRFYNPAKQARDHDPDGTFIRRWVPELARVPTWALAEPHRAPPLLQHQVRCVVGDDYPEPIVHPARAVQTARARMGRVRGQRATRAEAQRVFHKHGSRRGPMRSRRGGRGRGRGGSR